MAGELPRDCSMQLGSGRRCSAATRWLLVDPAGAAEYPCCNVHRSWLADELVAGEGWCWVDRRTAGLFPAHSGCLAGLASFGQSQTCRGAGAESRAGCPLDAVPVV